jgi:hypothetical protein
VYAVMLVGTCREDDRRSRLVNEGRRREVRSARSSIVKISTEYKPLARSVAITCLKSSRGFSRVKIALGIVLRLGRDWFHAPGLLRFHVSETQTSSGSIHNSALPPS